MGLKQVGDQDDLAMLQYLAGLGKAWCGQPDTATTVQLLLAAKMALKQCGQKFVHTKFPDEGRHARGLEAIDSGEFSREFTKLMDATFDEWGEARVEIQLDEKTFVTVLVGDGGDDDGWIDDPYGPTGDPYEVDGDGVNKEKPSSAKVA